MQLTDVPEGPTNVRILRDGREIPAETVYTGRRPDGIAVFTVVNAAFIPGDQLQMDRMPARTAVVVSSPKIDRCPQGHPMTTDNTGIDQHGYRYCKTCHPDQEKPAHDLD